MGGEKYNLMLGDDMGVVGMGCVTVSPLDACAQSQINDQDRAGTRGRNA